MFEGFFDALASVLNFFFTLVPEGLRGSLGFGLSIMGLTVLVMTLITPLTVKSTRSMMQMQRLQPEMKRIQEKHKDDREKLNQELMAFYRENQINPLGGCLPLIAQMPVFIIMYQLLRGLTVRPGGGGSGAGQTIAQVQQNVTTTPWLYTDQNFTPDHLNVGSELYEALSVTNDMNFLGMDLSLSAAQAVGENLLIAIPYLVLLLIMLGTGLYQNRQMQARNTSGSVNPQQQMLMRFMPFFLPVFSYGFPAGLALYWCTQNFCRIGTNAYITRSLYKKEQSQDDAIEASATERSSKKATAVESGSGTSKKTTSDKKTAPDKKAGTNGSAGPKDKGNDRRSKRRGDDSSSSKSKNATRPSGPGKSAKSQAAHRKTSGGSSSTGSSSSSNGRKVNTRRSGQSRRGPSSTSDK